jgi:hypothetical protein
MSLLAQLKSKGKARPQGKSRINYFAKNANSHHSTESSTKDPIKIVLHMCNEESTVLVPLTPYNFHPWNNP